MIHTLPQNELLFKEKTAVCMVKNRLFGDGLKGLDLWLLGTKNGFMFMKPFSLIPIVGFKLRIGFDSNTLYSIFI